MLGEVLALIAALCLALAPSFYAIGVRNTDPYRANAIRTIIATVFTLILAYILGELSGDLFKDWRLLLFMIGAGLIGAGGADLLYFHALERIDVSVAIPIVSSFPFWIALFSFILGIESLNLYVLLGLGTIGFGITLVTREQSKKRHSRTIDMTTKAVKVAEAINHPNQVKGVTFALLAAIITAIAFSMYNLGLEHLSPFQANAIRLPMVGALFFVVSKARSSARDKSIKRSRPYLKATLALGTGGILSLVFASLLLFYAMMQIGPTQSAAITSTNPVFAAIFSTIFLKEQLNWEKILGILLVCFGLILIAIF